MWIFLLGGAEMTVKETKLPIEGIAEHSQEPNLLAVFVWGISLTLRGRKISSGGFRATTFCREPLSSEI